VGKNLVTYSGNYKLNSTCADALRKLINAGKKAGYSYTLYSAYRSYSSQHSKYYNKIDYWKNEGYSEEEAIRLTNEYYAPPGASEHHTGLAADVCIPEIVNKYACLHENYDQTEEFKWFSTHAHEYGFILRYPNGDDAITGYSYEPWHYRYVGVEIATEIYKRDITLEEYVMDLESKLSALS
jgi:D-alanyl-D-alanine carboxypeptidase